MRDEDLTSRIIQCSFEVMNELGEGFLESVYENALMIALEEKGLSVEKQIPIDVYYHGKRIGHFVADLLVEKLVIVELKTEEKLHPKHQAQTINYLKATEMNTGLLINFGNAKLEIKRCRKPG